MSQEVWGLEHINDPADEQPETEYCLWCQAEILDPCAFGFCSEACERAYEGQKRAERKVKHG